MDIFPKIIAVDFDGTLCENKWPEIGEPNVPVINYVKKEKADGAKLILWTNRVGDKLQDAIQWCRNRDISFDAINENLPEVIEAFGGDCRKVFANEYLDDRMIPFPREKSDMETWAENEVRIACQREAPERKDDEWDYGCACYESALKAYKALMDDNHSGASFGITRDILIRLMNHRPLTPIEDTEDIWNIIDELNKSGISYQCRRMSSLFKTVFEDGTVKYRDVNRAYCVDIHNPFNTYASGLVNNIIDQLFPITMPYCPDGKFEVVCEDFLTDRNNGDFDTVGIFFTIKPNGEKIEINRFFKAKENAPGWEEIDLSEYNQRKERKIL